MLKYLGFKIILPIFFLFFHFFSFAGNCYNENRDTSLLLPFQYNRLEIFLKKYREIHSDGGWGKIRLGKKIYKPGDTSAVVSDVRHHLFVTGDLIKDNKSPVFDSLLYTSIITYRNRTGLKTDGKIDATLIAEMNIPVEKRIQKIMVNIERVKRMYAESDDNFLLVNIPEFRLHIYENSVPVHNMKVIIGQPNHKTVVFNGKIRYVVFCPYWNVPKSILNNEILPIIRRHPGYLSSKNMEWEGGLLRQKPGPDNSLGLIKFIFPNSHSIYMHDTPTKSLFNQNQRTFSHGCIRLENARWLAGYLLRNDSEWNSETIDAAISRRVEQFVTLKKPVPVYIAYFTAWVDETGRINFRKDIYNKDN
jgi:murein L,D-transpeptidase YcbB/YkuD